MAPNLWRLLASLALVAFLMSAAQTQEALPLLGGEQYASHCPIKGTSLAVKLHKAGYLSPDIIFVGRKLSRTVNKECGDNGVGGFSFKMVDSKAEILKLYIRLLQCGFDPDAITYFAMHGWNGGYGPDSWLRRLVYNYTSESHGRRLGSIGGSLARRNLFIVDWNHGATGPYTGAIKNIDGVAKYVSKFIDLILLKKVRDPSRIRLIGHSLGAHLAGSIAGEIKKMTNKRPGLIYALDPAGPCFGPGLNASGLDANDADEVIVIRTDKNCFGNRNELGKYLVDVEGGEKQPNCKDSCPSLTSFFTEPWSLFNKGCSHSRATELVEYNYAQEDNCQLVAYSCSSWDEFLRGHCGVCASSEQLATHTMVPEYTNSPLNPVECLLIGLDWQHLGSMSLPKSSDKRTVSMFIRTRDTQPYCKAEYQVVVEFNEPFLGEFPNASFLVLREPQSNVGELGTTSLYKHKSNKYLTTLLTSDKNMGRFNEALLAVYAGPHMFKSVKVNYMSHSGPEVRERFSSHLCPVVAGVPSSQTTSPVVTYLFKYCNPVSH